MKILSLCSCICDEEDFKITWRRKGVSSSFLRNPECLSMHLQGYTDLWRWTADCLFTWIQMYGMQALGCPMLGQKTVTSLYTAGTLYGLLQAPQINSRSDSPCHSVWGNLKQLQSCALTLCQGVSNLSLQVDISVFSVLPNGNVWQIGWWAAAQMSVASTGQRRVRSNGSGAWPLHELDPKTECIKV